MAAAGRLPATIGLRPHPPPPITTAVPRLLVINPNTTASVTAQVLAAGREAAPDAQWEGVTAAFGAAYIASETAYAIAAHAVLDAYAQHYRGHDAVLIACFGDPGLLALGELCPVPVVGLAEASLRAAAAEGPFAVVTGGTAWGPMLRRFARTHRLDAQLTGVHTVALTGAEIAADPARALDQLAARCRFAITEGAGRIVLGGAALAGLAQQLQPRVAVPVLDNVRLGIAALLDSVSPARADTGDSDAPATRVAGPVQGLGPELAWVLSG